MKERPILFTSEMVRAILDGRMTQMRRPVTPQPEFCGGAGEGADVSKWGFHSMDRTPHFVPVTEWAAPLGTVGHRLWVKETWGLKDSGHEDSPNVVYRADQDSSRMVWRPSIHMPRWASRIDLEITAVRVERAQDITEEDARKESPDSFLHAPGLCTEDPRMYLHKDGAWKAAFLDLWQSIHGTWDANPWVWVYEFRRIKP